MREVAVRGARTFAVGADVAGDVAHAPVAAAPLVVQRCARFREALQPDLLGATVDRVPERVAELQHVAQLAAGPEVDLGADRQVHAVALDLTPVDLALVDLDHPVPARWAPRHRAP